MLELFYNKKLQCVVNCFLADFFFFFLKTKSFWGLQQLWSLVYLLTLGGKAVWQFTRLGWRETGDCKC